VEARAPCNIATTAQAKRAGLHTDMKRTDTIGGKANVPTGFGCRHAPEEASGAATAAAVSGLENPAKMIWSPQSCGQIKRILAVMTGHTMHTVAGRLLLEVPAWRALLSAHGLSKEAYVIVTSEHHR